MSLNIVVCIKQVPNTNKVKVDEETGVLIRDGVEGKLNPYDLYAIEQALSLREKYGGRVSVISMGPPQAKEVLYEALYMGADDGALISDRRFAGADVVATSYTLSQGIKKTGNFDLIICGKQTTDGDTAQVGAETAEFLGLEHCSNINSITKIEDGRAVLSMNMEHQTMELSAKLPLLVTTDKGINTPRLPSYKRKCEIAKSGEAKIAVYSLTDLEDTNENNYGLKGSPTQVERIFPPQINTDREMFAGDSDEVSALLLAALRKRKLV